MAKKILIADDAKESRALIRIFLQKESYEVIEVTNGKDALNKITNEKPDLVILDLVMPILDGVSVAIELNKNKETQNIPVLISTSRGQLLDLLSLSGTTKIKGFIEKPFKPKELVEKVKNILQ